jgi:4-carboxymuconolactone decarboxylase
MSDDRRTKGEAMRRRVLGDAYVESRGGSTTDFNRDLEQFITEIAWGETWSRPGLDPKIRSVVTLVIAATRSQWDEFRVHVRGAMDNGLTREELKEVLLHTAIYGGFPAARTGFKEAAAVLAEMEVEGGRPAA